MTSGSPRAGRRTHRTVVALLLSAGLVTSGCSGEDYVAPPAPTTREVASPATAAETLAEFEAAVRDRDRARAVELGADPEAADLLGAIVANAGALELTDVTFGYLTETGRTSGEDGWDGQVAVTWRLAGIDTASARVELPVSFVDRGRRIAGIGGASSRSGRLPLWLSGPVDVRRSGEVVVAVAGDPTGAGRYLADARRAVAQVRSLLPGGGGLVVEVPADAEALRRTLDTTPGQYDAIAAVTAPVDGSQAPGSPVHVFLNRAVYDRLDEVAARVVMTHEAVHALTGAVAARQAPLWLVEGFADYVALRDVDLPVERTAGQIAAQVRKEGLPDALPAPTDFDPSASHLGAVYEAAWLVCVTLADHGGEQALVALYRAVRDGEDLSTALSRLFGWTEAQLTAAWRDRLAALAR